MNVFVDTSALLAVMDAKDGNHPKAAKTWEKLVSGDNALIVFPTILGVAKLSLTSLYFGQSKWRYIPG